MSGVFDSAVFDAAVFDVGEVAAPARRRRGVDILWPPARREEKREALAPVLPPVKPAQMPPKPPKAAKAKPQVAARSFEDLGRLLGMGDAALERARRRAEDDEDDEDVLALLM